MNKENWMPVLLCCPNCGEKSQVYMPAQGAVKSVCTSCLAVMVRRRIGRRHIRLDIYAPGEEGGFDEAELLGE